jgi:hypothetical protein
VHYQRYDTLLRIRHVVQDEPYPTRYEPEAVWGEIGHDLKLRQEIIRITIAVKASAIDFSTMSSEVSMLNFINFSDPLFGV